MGGSRSGSGPKIDDLLRSPPQFAVSKAQSKQVPTGTEPAAMEAEPSGLARVWQYNAGMRNRVVGPTPATPLELATLAAISKP